EGAVSRRPERHRQARDGDGRFALRRSAGCEKDRAADGARWSERGQNGGRPRFRAAQGAHRLRLLHVPSRRCRHSQDPDVLQRLSGQRTLYSGGLTMAPMAFDAIVVGSGISGGWAAKELTEHGLKTIVLEAGRPIDPAVDYVEHVRPWEKRYRGMRNRKQLERFQPIQRHTGACDEYASKFFV